ncbi:Hypothetical protein GLP15_4906 [Giardia lamblia P15]|uniref:Uncharacterized protein n=1 Tax=Giardia intestinalis (strain P15) TaxID=658858 RepID=E1F9S9_GIAIA|nr:Hypothetical protein GLP15_4906 [Giardia lamblia P15]
MIGRPASPLILLVLKRDSSKLKESLDLWVTNRDKTGRTALLYAVTTAFKEAIFQLLPYEADIRDHEGNGVRELCDDPEVLALLDEHEASLETSLRVQMPSPVARSPPFRNGMPSNSTMSSPNSSLLIEKFEQSGYNSSQQQHTRSPSTEIILDAIQRPVGILPASSPIGSSQNAACTARVPSLNQSYILRSLQLCTNAELFFSTSSLTYSTTELQPDNVRSLLVAIKAFYHPNVSPYARLVYLEERNRVILLPKAIPSVPSLMSKLHELKAQQAKFTDFELTSLFVTLLSIGKAVFETRFVRLLDLSALIHPCNIAYLGNSCFMLHLLPLKYNFPKVMEELGSTLVPNASFKEGAWNQFCLNLTSFIVSYMHMDLTSNYVVGFHISHPDYPALSKTVSSLLYKEVPRDVAPRSTRRSSADGTHRRSFLFKTSTEEDLTSIQPDLIIQGNAKRDESPKQKRAHSLSRVEEIPIVRSGTPTFNQSSPSSAPKEILTIDINSEALATDLMLAASTGDLAGVVKAKHLLRLQDSNGHTALMYAAAAGHLSVIGLLLGDEYDILDHNGNGPEEYASSATIRRRILAYRSTRPG